MLHLHSNHGLTLRRLWLSALIFFLSFLIQGLGGFLTGSIGLISDSLENLNDVFVNTLSMGSLWVAHKQSPDHRWPYGLHRLEVVNGLIVVILLGLFGFFVGSEALDRLQNPQPIQTGKVLLFALSGLILNLVATRILVPNEEDLAKNNLNLKGAYIHALLDSVTSIVLMISMVAIRFTGWTWIDPLVALLILGLIARGMFVLLKDILSILLHWAAFNHQEAIDDLKKLPGILDVQDMRSWKICSHLAVATAHVVIEAERLEETEAYLEDIEHLLWEKYKVRHLTIHFENQTMADRHHHLFIHNHDSAGVEDPIHKGPHLHSHPHQHD